MPSLQHLSSRYYFSCRCCVVCPMRCQNVLSCCLVTVDGAWSMWTNWADCNVTCGSGWTTRKRSCNNPTPFFGGLTCPGQARDSKTCSINCPGTATVGQVKGSRKRNEGSMLFTFREL